MPTLDYVNELKNNPNAQILLTHKDFTYVGYKSDELSLSSSAEYGNAYAEAMQEMNQKIQIAYAETSNLAGLDFGAISNLATRRQTKHFWTGSQRPQVPINMTLIRWSMSDKPVSETAFHLQSFTMPNNPDGSDLSPLQNPGDYNPADDTGTWIVRIGQYFKAENLLMTSCNVTLSPQTVSDGSPLLAQVQMSFEPSMLVGAEQFRQWNLIGGS